VRAPTANTWRKRFSGGMQNGEEKKARDETGEFCAVAMLLLLSFHLWLAIPFFLFSY
jgi:hypothetical protein